MGAFCARERAAVPVEEAAVSFRFALCNEVYRLPIEETIPRVARLGFDGIEIAPFTVADSVEDVPASRRREIARLAREAGIEIVGLHWLLVSPAGLHLSTEDAAVLRRTVEYLKALARFCADLGGTVMVLGSPKQRSLVTGQAPEDVRRRVADALRAVAETCGERGTRLLIEPLSPAETNFITTVEEALSLRDLVAHPAVGYILDCKAMSAMPKGILGTIGEHGRAAGHVHANEPGGLGPGMGELDFHPILSALRSSGYRGWISTEPFHYEPDPDTVARTALETLRRAALQVPGT